LKKGNRDVRPNEEVKTSGPNTEKSRNHPPTKKTGENRKGQVNDGITKRRKGGFV